MIMSVRQLCSVAVNRLPYIWTRSASSSIFWVLDLDLYRDGIMSGTCQRGTWTMRKPVYMYFNRKPVTDIHTYKHNLRLRRHKRLPLQTIECQQLCSVTYRTIISDNVMWTRNQLQWNLWNKDTTGPCKSVLISEVSLIQRFPYVHTL